MSPSELRTELQKRTQELELKTVCRGEGVDTMTNWALKGTARDSEVGRKEGQTRETWDTPIRSGRRRA